jgi:hypothetical protein
MTGAACSKDKAKPAAKAEPSTVSVDELAKQLDAKAARAGRRQR